MKTKIPAKIMIGSWPIPENYRLISDTAYMNKSGKSGALLESKLTGVKVLYCAGTIYSIHERDLL